MAEAYEVLSAGRDCVRMTPPEALVQMTAKSGLEFDPAIVDALGRIVRDGNLEPVLPSVALPAVAAVP